MTDAFASYTLCGLALDPIHVGTGGSRLGRVDNTIVRDPATSIPKIPGSSLAGVLRAYAAMEKGKYPGCAGQGQPKPGASGGHCGQASCPVCTVFGFAKGGDAAQGFAGLAGFSDMHVLLFPAPTLQGPVWVTSPLALRQSGIADEKVPEPQNAEAVYRRNGEGYLNLGWLYLPVKTDWPQWDTVTAKLEKLKIDPFITEKLVLVSDKLFGHVVNGNLEIRTSVAIDPTTGSAEDKALFTYEALPRGTVLVSELICKNPGNYGMEKARITAVESIEAVKSVVAAGFPYLEHLGIGGMGSRGMGRLRILSSEPVESKATSEGGKA